MNRENPRAVSYTLKILGMASGIPSPFDDQYIVEYDPTRQGRILGSDWVFYPLTTHLICDPDISKARRFGDAGEAHAYWVQESGHPYPADKPLVAFTVAIEETPADVPDPADRPEPDGG